MKPLKTLVRLVRGALGTLRSVLLSRQGVVVGPKLRPQGRISIFRAQNSVILLGARVVLNADARKNTLEARGPVVLRTFRSGAKILIGSDSGLTSCTISAGSCVEIGERVLVGGGVVITDSDHHVVDMLQGRRFAGLPEDTTDKPIKIDDDVFIGMRSIVLKGVHIGKGSVIGAGSVVTTSIPAGVVAAGNPCRVVRRISGVPTSSKQ